MTLEQKIQISKARVFDEVAKTTAYIGKKATSDRDQVAYERVALVDANREQLDRWWMEACGEAAKILDHWAVSTTNQMPSHHPEISADHDFKITLALPSNWAWAYLPTVSETIMSYLVYSIIVKWLLITHKPDAKEYAALQSGVAAQIGQLMLARRRPVKRSSGGSSDGDGAAWVRTNTWVRSEPWTRN